MIRVRALSADDIPFGMALKDRAGWNQTCRDWSRMLLLEPHGGFVAEWNGTPVGTVMVTTFDDVAWISMLLVDAAYRRRGVGRSLMEVALCYAEQQGALSLRLDATPMGRPLYEQLGFAADFELIRYVGRPQPTSPSLVIHPQLDELVELDRMTTGTNRRRLFELLHTQQPFWSVGGSDRLRGFISARPGSHSLQIGPCVADDVAGPLLLKHAFAEYADQAVLMDIPTHQRAAINLCQTHGLMPQRTLLRMTRGQPVSERIEWLWASFGPEKG